MTAIPQAPDHSWKKSLGDHKKRQGDEIAQVAVAIMMNRGVAALSMSSVAKEAGISRQTLYRYYPDIDHVLAAAIASEGGLSLHLEEVSQAGTVIEQLEMLVELILGAAAGGHPSPASMSEMLSPEVRRTVRDHANRVEDFVVGVVETGVADGSFDSSIDPRIDGRIVHRLVLAAHDLAADPSMSATVTERTKAMIRRVLSAEPR